MYRDTVLHDIIIIGDLMNEKENPTKKQNENINFYKAGSYYGTVSVKEFRY